jgi:hypothetical protein
MSGGRNRGGHGGQWAEESYEEEEATRHSETAYTGEIH